MNHIGIFVCNYNKSDFVVQCVRRILDQTYQAFDVWVIDNASTDDSVSRLREEYGDRIMILQNEENIGGSGGFGRGIRVALEKKYRYLMLVDNDAMLDCHVVEYLYQYLEDHPDVGICGAETLNLQRSDRIQDLGGRLDYTTYDWSGVIHGMKDIRANLILETDYVASCSVMARVDAVRKFGGFPEDNFIYWDDVEWCTKCWRAGYKVVVNGNAKAYHDLSMALPSNLFYKYYATRNRFQYFAKYLPDDKIDDFYHVITREILTKLYSSMYQGMSGTALTVWNAFDDFLNGVRGKAEERILPFVENKRVFPEKIRKAKKVLIYMPTHRKEDYERLHKLIHYVTDINPEIEIGVALETDEKVFEQYDLNLQICEHVTRIQENILPRIYVDDYYNYISDEAEYFYFRNFEAALENFRNLYAPIFRKRIEIIRKNTVWQSDS